MLIATLTTLLPNPSLELIFDLKMNGDVAYGWPSIKLFTKFGRNTFSRFVNANRHTRGPVGAEAGYYTSIQLVCPVSGLSD